MLVVLLYDLVIKKKMKQNMNQKIHIKDFMLFLQFLIGTSEKRTTYKGQMAHPQSVLCSEILL